jgi:two-component system NarL family response regulator
MRDDNTRYNLNPEEKKFEPAKLKKLTNREKEILKYSAIGDKTSSIANKLGIAESTVKNHKTNIFQKLNVNSSAEAVFFAINHSLI